MVEEAVASLYPEQDMRCPVHLCVGQEAIPAGVCSCLKEQDYVLGGHRSHGHYLAKGGDLKAMMAEMYGKSTGCSGGKGGSMHLVDRKVGFLASTPIVGSTLPIAVGVALASVMRKESRVTVVFFGDAVPEEGVFCESINFAVLKNLPVLFVCENNAFSVNSPLSVRQPEEREIYHMGQGHGMKSCQGNGNDVMEVHRLAEQAVERARNGGGPTLLEFKTYRWLEHCGPYDDSDLECRSRSELEEWKRNCPIEMLGGRMIARQGSLAQDMEKLRNDVAVEIEEAVRFAKESPFPGEDRLGKHLYSNSME